MLLTSTTVKQSKVLSQMGEKKDELLHQGYFARLGQSDLLDFCNFCVDAREPGWVLGAFSSSPSVLAKGPPSLFMGALVTFFHVLI